MPASPSLALSLALALAQVPPADAAPTSAETDAPDPTATPAPAEPVAEGPKPEPAPAPAPGNRPPEPRWRGIGMMVTSGIFGALGLAFNVGRVVIVRDLCRDFSVDPNTGMTIGYSACANGGLAAGALAPLALVSNIAAFGLSGGAGAEHGRWAAHRTAFAGERRRMAGLQIGLGAGVMAAGLLTYGVVRGVSIADGLGIDTCSDRHPVDASAPDAEAEANALADCIRRRWSGYLIGITVGQAASVVGVGLLAHGAAYNRNLKLYRYIASGNLRLQPSFSPGYAGMALGGRF